MTLFIKSSNDASKTTENFTIYVCGSCIVYRVKFRGVQSLELGSTGARGGPGGQRKQVEDRGKR